MIVMSGAFVVRPGRVVVAAILCQRIAGSLARPATINAAHLTGSIPAFFLLFLTHFSATMCLSRSFHSSTDQTAEHRTACDPTRCEWRNLHRGGRWQFAENLAQNCNIARLQSHAIPVSFQPFFTQQTADLRGIFKSQRVGPTPRSRESIFFCILIQDK